MILIDRRKGSGELIRLFDPFGIECYLACPDTPFYAFALLDDPKQIDLPSCDFAFWGNGPDGLILVGMERKVTTDFIDSMRTHRLSGHQLPRMDIYGYRHIIIEGISRVGDSGALETFKYRKGQRPGFEPLYRGSRPVVYTEPDHHRGTLEYKRGIVFKETADEKQTVAYIVSRYRWFNEKTWNQHRSDEAIYANYQPISGTGGRKMSFTRRTVSDAERMLSQIPGIDSMAYCIAKSFLNSNGVPSLERVMMAGVDELARVMVERQTKVGVKMVRLGEERGRKVYLALRGEL